MLGYDAFGYNAFNNMLEVKNIYKVDTGFCVLDEIKIDNIIMEYNSTKQEWGYNTVLLSKFEGTLEGGNVDNKGMEVEYICIEKREVGQLKWDRVALIPYETTKQIYKYIDKYVQSTQEYEYAVLPLTANVKGVPNIKQITCDFDNIWLVNKDKQIQLKCNQKQGEFSNSNTQSIIEPLESQYPIIFQSNSNYAKSSISATIVSENTIQTNVINKQNERKTRDNVFNFLRDRKPKIFKSGDGKFILVQLGNIKEIPNNELGCNLSDVSFDITEIGNASKLSDLEETGLVNPLGITD